MSELLIAKDIKAYYKTFDGQEIKAVDGVSITLNENEVLGIAGESGCGKSTLASVLSLLFRPPLYLKGGEMWLGGVDAFKLTKEELRKNIRGKYISLIPQGAMNSLNPTRKVKQMIIDVLKEHNPNMTTSEILDLAKERVEALSLPPRILESYPHQLSGGMKQRAVILISTLLNPKILIADEPTSALDVSSQKIVIKLLVGLLEKSIIKSIIFITHELPLLRHFTDRIAVMYAGKIVEIGKAEDIIFNPLHPYTKALMSTMLVPEPYIKKMKIEGIPGLPPNLKDPPKGCRFYPRCSQATEDCKFDEPKPKEWDGRLVWCEKA